MNEKLLKALIESCLEDRQNQESYNNNDNTFLEIGGNYLIRTVTMIYTGKIKAIRGNEILLTDAAWIADTGRFSDCLKSCEFNEVEPYHRDVVVYRLTFLDCTKIDNLPTIQK